MMHDKCTPKKQTVMGQSLCMKVSRIEKWLNKQNNNQANANIICNSNFTFCLGKYVDLQCSFMLRTET